MRPWPYFSDLFLKFLAVGAELGQMTYDKLSTNITITFASHRKSVHKLQIRPIVSPSIAPKNDLLIR